MDSNFIKSQILDDLEKQKNSPIPIKFRFPPEPNGYLHLGHAKAICLNYSLAKELNDTSVATTCHLRFDDTNPSAEDSHFYNAIREDLSWLGFLTPVSDAGTTCFTSNQRQPNSSIQ